jgi:hypothetical protein
MNPANIVTRAGHVEGFVTDASCLIDIFALDFDRCTGAVTARQIASGIGAAGAAPIGRWRWDVNKFNINDDVLMPAYRNVQVQVRKGSCAAGFDPANPIMIGGGGGQIIANQYQAPVSGVCAVLTPLIVLCAAV